MKTDFCKGIIIQGLLCALLAGCAAPGDSWDNAYKSADPQAVSAAVNYQAAYDDNILFK